MLGSHHDRHETRLGVTNRFKENRVLIIVLVRDRMQPLPRNGVSHDDLNVIDRLRLQIETLSSLDTGT